ncbi:hypothetical protein [Infirmifilum sp. SLHALR2]|nr:MAG: hypothetical protein B7L53_08900 [Thermofilum sp. NZ13]
MEPSRGSRKRGIEELQRTGYAVEEALRITKRLRAKVILMPERAERVASQASRKVQRVNDDWIRGVLRELRNLVRRRRGQGYTVVIVADVLRAGSLGEQSYGDPC